MAAYPQSVAYTRTFMMVQTSDHITGLTGATVTVLISKAGAGGGAAAGTVSQVDATNNPGLYKVALTTADTNTLGDLSFHCTATSGDPTDFVDQVIDPIRGLGSPTAIPNTAVTTNGSLLTSGTGTDQLSVTSGKIDLGKILGTVATAATAGVLDVNMKNANNVAATAITTINANLGSTQPFNFTGTGASALVKGDAVDWAGGAIPAPNVTGVPLVDVKYFLGTLSAGAAGYAGLDWAHINAPTTTVDLSGTTIKNLDNTPPGGPGTAAQIATAVWQDTTAGDFTVASSIGKSLYTSGVIPGAAGGLFIAGSNAATTVNITGTWTGNIVGTVSTVTNLTNAPTNGDFTTTMKTSITMAATAASPTLDWSKVTNQSSTVVLSNTIISETVNVNNILLGGITNASFAAGVLPTNFALLAIDGSGFVTYNNAAPPSAASITAAVLTTQMTESYAGLNVVPTLAQLLFEIRAILGENSVATNIMTIAGIDGTTPVEQFTLDSATAPTSITRSA